MGRPATSWPSRPSAIALRDRRRRLRCGGRGSDVSGRARGRLLLTLIPLLSPQGWDYVFLVSTPAIMLLVNYEDRLPRVTASSQPRRARGRSR